MNVELSNRLQHIMEFLPENLGTFADIGSDHAHLPCAVCLNRPNVQAVAGEVNQGPFESAMSQVRKLGLANRVDVRLGSGLEVLEANEVDAIVIAGMGGTLIRSILESHPDRLHGVKRLILQPNIDAASIRSFAMKYGYEIIEEMILDDQGYIYEIVVLEPGENRLTEKEIYLGPYLIKEKNEAFLSKWKQVHAKKKKIIHQMKQAKEPNWEKIKQFEQQITWIEEEIE